MALHKNYINGEWVEGKDRARTISIPPTCPTSSATMPRPTRPRPRRPSPPPRAACPGLAGHHAAAARRYSRNRRAPSFSPARTRSAGSCRARKASRSPTASPRSMRAAQIFKFHRPGGAARSRASPSPRSARRRSDGDPRSRSASSASSARGISRSPFRPGKWRRRWPSAIPWCSSRPIWCRARPGRWSRSCRAPACPRASSIWSWARGSVVGQTMLESKDVNAISFTGSVETGAKVAMACAARGAKFQLEMGGKNPLIVLDDANLDAAVAAVDRRRLLPDRPALHRLLAPHRAEQDPRCLRGEDGGGDEGAEGRSRAQGRNPGRARSSTRTSWRRTSNISTSAAQEGAELVWGGERLNRDTKGHYLSPALFASTNNEMRINREEIFGPVASVIKVDSYDEALAVANDTTFGLSSGIFTTSLKHAERFPQEFGGRHGDGQSADGGRRLSRALRRPQRLELWRRASRAAMRRSSTPRSRPPTRWRSYPPSPSPCTQCGEKVPEGRMRGAVPCALTSGSTRGESPSSGLRPPSPLRRRRGEGANWERFEFQASTMLRSAKDLRVASAEPLRSMARQAASITSVSKPRDWASSAE